MSGLIRATATGTAILIGTAMSLACLAGPAAASPAAGWSSAASSAAPTDSVAATNAAASGPASSSLPASSAATSRATASTSARPSSATPAPALAQSGSVSTTSGTVKPNVPDGAAAANGSAYLVSQLVDGDHLTTSSYLDYGLTADTALALASTNDQDAALARITGYLRAHVADYADPAGKAKDYPGPFSGAVAKLALVAEVTGQDPHSFGGYDLLQVLIDNVCTAPDSSGGYLCTAPGDFTQAYSTISQALGVLALARAGVTPPAAAVARLEQLQCSDGGFTSTLITAGGTCTSDTDATGYAAQALNLVPGAAAAVTAARGYLLNAQQSDGGFLGASGENTNSTGLGGQALQAIGTTAPVITQSKDGAQLAPHAVPAGTDPLAAARAFLLAQQLGNGGFQIGAAQPGVADARASSQAVPLLAGATLAGLSDPVTPVTPPVTAPSSGGSSAAGAPSGGLAHSTAPAPSTQATDPAATAALANTGSSARAPLGWALGLIALGVLAMLLGRRRIKVPVPASRRRH